MGDPIKDMFGIGVSTKLNQMIDESYCGLCMCNSLFLISPD